MCANANFFQVTIKFIADLFMSCTFEKIEVSSAKAFHIEIISSGRSFM